MDLEQLNWRWPATWSKSEWGPYGWNWLHTLAATYPDSPDVEQASTVYRRLWGFASRLPCGECRTHAIAYIKANPPFLKTAAGFQHWAWRFHSSVNERLGHRDITFDAYIARYPRSRR